MTENHPNGPTGPQNENWDEEPTRIVGEQASAPSSNGSSPLSQNNGVGEQAWQGNPNSYTGPSTYGQQGYGQPGQSYAPPAGNYTEQGSYQQGGYQQNGYQQQAPYNSAPPSAWGAGNQQGPNMYGSQPVQPVNGNPWAAQGQSQNAYGQSPSWYGSTINGVGVGQYAHWGKRVAASFIDWAIQIPFFIFLIPCIPRYTHYADTGVTRQTGGSWALTSLVYFLLLVLNCVNNYVLQGRNGQTIGKRVLKIRLVSESTGMPIGIALAIVRSFAHILDSIPFCVGFLWPLWDVKRQTFADKVMSTVVVEQQSR